MLLVRDNATGGEESRLRTSFLHLVTPRSLARTDREVEFAAPGRSLRGRGMEYDNRTGQLVLHALATRPTSPRDLARIRELLDEIEGGTR